MKIVKESIGFKRGGDPRKTLEIGNIYKAKKWIEPFLLYLGEDIDNFIEIDDRGYITVLKSLRNNRISISYEGADIHNGPMPSIIKNIRGSLIIPQFPTTSLPDNLSVDGTLDIRWTGIKELPKGLRVRDDLVIAGIKKIPDDVEAYSIYALHSNLEEISPFAQIHGVINIRGTLLEKRLHREGEIDDFIEEWENKGVKVLLRRNEDS